MINEIGPSSVKSVSYENAPHIQPKLNIPKLFLLNNVVQSKDHSMVTSSIVPQISLLNKQLLEVLHTKSFGALAEINNTTSAAQTNGSKKFIILKTNLPKNIPTLSANNLIQNLKILPAANEKPQINLIPLDIKQGFNNSYPIYLTYIPNSTKIIASNTASAQPKYKLSDATKKLKRKPRKTSIKIKDKILSPSITNENNLILPQIFHSPLYLQNKPHPFISEFIESIQQDDLKSSHAASLDLCNKVRLGNSLDTFFLHDTFCRETSNLFRSYHVECRPKPCLFKFAKEFKGMVCYTQKTLTPNLVKPIHAFCLKPALPYTNFCKEHIGVDVNQRLFERCSAKFPNDIQCSTPTFDLLNDVPLCRQHAWKKAYQDNSILNSKCKRTMTNRGGASFIGLVSGCNGVLESGVLRQGLFNGAHIFKDYKSSSLPFTSAPVVAAPTHTSFTKPPNPNNHSLRSFVSLSHNIIEEATKHTKTGATTFRRNKRKMISPQQLSFNSKSKKEETEEESRRKNKNDLNSTILSAYQTITHNLQNLSNLNKLLNLDEPSHPVVPEKSAVETPNNNHNIISSYLDNNLVNPGLLKNIFSNEDGKMSLNNVLVSTHDPFMGMQYDKTKKDLHGRFCNTHYNITGTAFYTTPISSNLNYNFNKNVINTNIPPLSNINNSFYNVDKFLNSTPSSTPIHDRIDQMNTTSIKNNINGIMPILQPQPGVLFNQDGIGTTTTAYPHQFNYTTVDSHPQFTNYLISSIPPVSSLPTSLNNNNNNSSSSLLLSPPTLLSPINFNNNSSLFLASTVNNGSSLSNSFDLLDTASLLNALTNNNQFTHPNAAPTTSLPTSTTFHYLPQPPFTTENFLLTNLNSNTTNLNSFLTNINNMINVSPPVLSLLNLNSISFNNNAVPSTSVTDGLNDFFPASITSSNNFDSPIFMANNCCCNGNDSAFHSPITPRAKDAVVCSIEDNNNLLMDDEATLADISRDLSALIPDAADSEIIKQIQDNLLKEFIV